MPKTALQPQELPVLYSFRRCPYAIRTRMTLDYTGIPVELRDILLKDKPADMTLASPKATVPVLKVSNREVLEESLDIMNWALAQCDPENWLPDNPLLRGQIFSLVEQNDGPFKEFLDRYKYHVRFPESSREEYRSKCEQFLTVLESRLADQKYLMSDDITYADIAIFPFLRQFANSDRNWFDQAPYPRIQQWLKGLTTSKRFLRIMRKNPIWEEGTPGIPFPDPHGS